MARHPLWGVMSGLRALVLVEGAMGAMPGLHTIAARLTVALVWWLWGCRVLSYKFGHKIGLHIHIHITSTQGTLYRKYFNIKFEIIKLYKCTIIF